MRHETNGSQEPLPRMPKVEIMLLGQYGWGMACDECDEPDGSHDGAAPQLPLEYDSSPALIDLDANLDVAA